MLWSLILAVVVLGAALGVALPFLRPADTWQTPDSDSELDRLLREKQRTLRTLKDLDQELRAGLMDRSAYDEARAEYVEQAVTLNRELASLTGVDPSRMPDDRDEVTS